MEWSFKKVLNILQNIDNHYRNNEELLFDAYYLGGSLCLDLEDHPNIVLNRNGRGFFYNFKNSERRKYIHFVMTNEMRYLVNDIYEQKLKASINDQ